MNEDITLVQALAIMNAITITVAYVVDGEIVLETDCRDHDHFCSLPAAVEYEGVVCGKTGWSSDRNYACYKSGQKVAYGV